MLKAKVKEIAEIVNSGIQPLQNLRILKHVENAFVIDTIERGLSAIENKLSSPDYNIKSGKYALGTSYPTLADICIIPQLENARRFGIDVTKYATLSALDTFVSMNQCFIAAAPTSCPDAR
jgi:glutathione S-transferase